MNRNSKQYPYLLFWISWLTKGEFCPLPSNLTWTRENGVILDGDHYAGNVYRANLLEELALHDQNSYWGKLALVEMIRRGWNERSTCRGYSVSKFLTVILIGKKFLQEHPHSEFSLRIVLDLARAYETWWDLPREKFFSGERGVNVNFLRSRYKKDSNAARKEAIYYYTLYLQKQNPLSLPEKIYIQEILLLLKKKLDTEETVFFYPEPCE